MNALRWMFCSALLLVLCGRATVAEPLPFRRAIELAVSQSSVMMGARAEQMRAQRAYQETRNAYIPQVVVGSGLGASYGFPLSLEGSAPSAFNVNTQSLLLNFAHRDFVRAARREWQASTQGTQDKRSQVVLDTALTYMELDALASKLNVLRQQEADARRAEQVVSERVREGVDSQLELTKTRLAAARIRMQLAQAQGGADVLRDHLAQLTGVAAQSLSTVTESIPKLPDVSQQDELAAKAVSSNPAVKVADERALARELRARGERKQLYPAVDLAGQYALLTRFNNYEDFYRKFQRHNGTVGVAIRFPFLNSAQRSRADAAEAEALAARKEAETLKGQVSNATLKLQRGVEQLKAARDVAQLESQLAQADLDTIQTKAQAGQATVRDEQNARLEANARYAAFLDASFELDKVRLQLLQATGELEPWAMQ
jgi:outer membrane protein TolC